MVSEGKLARWYFLLCFVAGIITSLLTSSIIVFGLVMHKWTSRSLLGISMSVAFFLWATREMYREYRGHF